MWCKLLSSLILFSGFLSRPWIIGAINLGFEETFEPERTISVVGSSYRQFNQHSITRRALQCLLDYSLSTANSILFILSSQDLTSPSLSRLDQSRKFVFILFESLKIMNVNAIFTQPRMPLKWRRGCGRVGGVVIFLRASKGTFSKGYEQSETTTTN